MLNMSCQENPVELQKRLDSLGEHHFAQKEYTQAIEAWNKLLISKPDSVKTLQKLGKAYNKIGSYHTALQVYNNILALQPNSPAIWLQTAKNQLILEDIYSAEQSLKKIPPGFSLAETLILQGDILATQKKYSDAKKLYKQVLDTEPHNLLALSRLAICLLGLQEREQADAVYATLASLQPNSADTLIQMSNFWRLKKNFTESEKFINQAIDLEPENTGLKLELASLYIDYGDFGRAHDILQDILYLQPDNRYAKKTLIETLLQANRFAEAENILDNLTESEEKDLEFQLTKGKYFLTTLQHHNAVSLFQMVLLKEPKLPLAHYFLALSYLAGGQNKLGQKALIKTLTLNPDFSEAELTLAATYYKGGNYQLAREHAQRIKNKEPENFRAHLILANIALATENFAIASEEFRAAQLLFPELPSPLYYSAMIEFLSGNTKEGLQLLQNLLHKNPQLIDASLQYVKVLIDNGDHSKAIEFLQKAVKNNPNNPYLHHLLGETFLSAGDQQEAVAAFNQALSLDPSLKASYLQLFHLKAAEQNQLVELLKTAIKQIRNFHEAQVKLAHIYSLNGNPAEAISLLEEAISATPDSPQVANNLAWLYLRHQPQDIDEAMRLSQLAYEQLPENPAVADTLGWIYFKKGMCTRAAWLLEEAAKLAPENPLINFHYGQVLKDQGHNEQAFLRLNRALDIGLDPTLRLEAEKSLEEITTRDK